jgi:hypothetical protein
MKQPSTSTPMPTNLLDAVGGLVTIMLVVSIGVGWYFGYVQPREEFLLTVAECTGDDPSEAAWKLCSEQVRQEIVQ